MNSTVKKILTVATVALVLWFIIDQPKGASGLVHSILGTLEHWALQIIAFVKGLFA